MACSSSISTTASDPSRFLTIVDEVERVRSTYRVWDDPLSLKLSDSLDEFLISQRERDFERGVEVVHRVAKKILICNIDNSFVENPVVGEDGRLWKEWMYRDCKYLFPDHPCFKDPPLVHAYGSAVGHLLVEIYSLLGGGMVVLASGAPSRENGYLDEEKIRRLPDQMKRYTYNSRLRFMPNHEKNRKIEEATKASKEEFVATQAKNAATSRENREKYARDREETKQKFAKVFQAQEEQSKRQNQQREADKQALEDLAEKARESLEKDAKQKEEFKKQMEEEAEALRKGVEAEVGSVKINQNEIDQKLLASNQEYVNSLFKLRVAEEPELIELKRQIVDLTAQLEATFKRETVGYCRRIPLVAKVAEIESNIASLQTRYNELRQRVGC